MVVGHSFGGLVVQSAVGQILEDRAVRTKGGDYGCQLDVEGFANLVVLINHVLPDNQIRPWALGRSNWPFAGSQRSGKRTAAIMSLLQPARLMENGDSY